jgi:transaldolase
MKFFLDTASLEEIREIASWGILDGVTTNPSLVAKEDRPFLEIAAEICRIVPGPVSLECVSTEAESMVTEGRKLAALAPNVVIKIPVGIEGLKAARKLSEEGLAVNMTLVFSPAQALLAAKAGSRYVSPFIGRLDDISEQGMFLVEQIVEMFGHYAFETEVIVASIRQPRQVVDAALIGADIVTLPYAVMAKLVRHPLTDIGLDAFLKDWEKSGKQGL